ncbi:hypothetical protein [Aurantimonas endophytica]|uniref:hypothetical protein n=1 Tax=Aurantimonas endophytica TaxID=1522175 RepID=UPI003002DD82
MPSKTVAWQQHSAPHCSFGQSFPAFPDDNLEFDHILTDQGFALAQRDRAVRQHPSRRGPVATLKSGKDPRQPAGED